MFFIGVLLFNKIVRTLLCRLHQQQQQKLVSMQNARHGRFPVLRFVVVQWYELSASVQLAAAYINTHGQDDSGQTFGFSVPLGIIVYSESLSMAPYTFSLDRVLRMLFTHTPDCSCSAQVSDGHSLGIVVSLL